MIKLELLEILRDLYENCVPVNFNSLLNTLKLCDEIVEYYVSSTTHNFYNNEPCYCINIYTAKAGERARQCGNLWVGFIDNSNVYILQYYSMENVELKHNINRPGLNKDEYVNITAIRMQAIQWKRDIKVIKGKIISQRILEPDVRLECNYRGEFD